MSSLPRTLTLLWWYLFSNPYPSHAMTLNKLLTWWRWRLVVLNMEITPFAYFISWILSSLDIPTQGLCSGTGTEKGDEIKEAAWTGLPSWCQPIGSRGAAPCRTSDYVPIYHLWVQAWRNVALFVLPCLVVCSHICPIQAALLSLPPSCHIYSHIKCSLHFH